MGRTLRAMGIGRHDRVAVVLPNGPEMAVAILTVAASAACAPLNPAYGAEELDRYFADLRPRALITQAGIDSPARRVALSRGIRVIELSTASEAEAGLFALTGDQGSAPSHEPVSPNDVALLLPTSGTTSRPKIVPQTHANICMSAYAPGAALALTETDRCLNVLPLFHGHGLTATVMASLAAGASVVCTPGFDVNSFSAWLTAFQPTWYSAVPTIHQAILAQRSAQSRATGGLSATLRPLLVCSPAAPHLHGTGADFRDPRDRVVRDDGNHFLAYRLQSAATAPAQGGLGRATVGLDVAIMDEGGALLPRGQTGEVVVRGASVTPGYDGDPMATEAAFAGDWFKTGDLGFFDDDGYLFLAGRVREIINRGGEKVAPQEVDEVLLEHPAVAEAVTFAVPHATLGEDVASAVVLRSHLPRRRKKYVSSPSAASPTSRFRAKCSSSRKSQKARPAKCSVSAWRRNWVSRMALLMPRAFVAPRTPLEKVLAKHLGRDPANRADRYPR